MCRPTRTRRLSIAAFLSLLAFVVLAGTGVRSLFVYDQWDFGRHTIELGNFGIGYQWMSGASVAGQNNRFFQFFPIFHMSGGIAWTGVWQMMKFSVINEDVIQSRPGALKMFAVVVPLWFPILLLLIAPLRWLIARPPNAPAFPVIEDVKRA